MSIAVRTLEEVSLQLQYQRQSELIVDIGVKLPCEPSMTDHHPTETTPLDRTFPAIPTGNRAL